MKKFEISEQLANKILQYLGSRPFVEVFQMVEELKSIKPIEEVKAEEVKE